MYKTLRESLNPDRRSWTLHRLIGRRHVRRRSAFPAQDCKVLLASGTAQSFLVQWNRDTRQKYLRVAAVTSTQQKNAGMSARRRCPGPRVAET